MLDIMVVAVHRTRRVRRELRVAAYAVCIDSHQILLARYHEHGNPHWTLPGGGVEHGEDPHDAAIREVAEETGYLVEVTHLLGIQSKVDRYPRPWRRSADQHSIRVIYAARVVAGELRDEVNGSTDMASWIDLDELDSGRLRRCDLVGVGLDLNRKRPRTGRT